MGVWPSVGMKCVCIDLSPGEIEPEHGCLPGDIYTVLEINNTDFREPAVRVRNERSGRSNDWNEYGRLSRYRPLITKSQEDDTGMFREIAHSMTPLERLDRLADLLDLEQPAEGG